MFKLIGKLFRWYSKIMWWKMMFILFGISTFIISVYFGRIFSWHAGDGIDNLHENCSVAIKEEPYYLTFKSLGNQSLKTVSDKDKNRLSLPNGNFWSLSLSKKGNYDATFYSGFLSSRSFEYKIKDGKALPIKCSRINFFLDAAVGTTASALLFFFIGRLRKKWRNRKNPPENNIDTEQDKEENNTGLTTSKSITMPERSIENSNSSVIEKPKRKKSKKAKNKGDSVIER